MRKPLKIYLFFLLLITAFGLIGNIFIQSKPTLTATDINADIPGSETMVALYEPLTATLGEDHIVDIIVTPVKDTHEAELILITTSNNEKALQQQTVDVLQQLKDVLAVSHITIQWLFNDDVALQASFTQPIATVTASTIQERAATYTFTQLSYD